MAASGKEGFLASAGISIDVSSDTSVESESEVYLDDSFSPKCRGRKRKKDPDSWKRNVAKRARNSGQSYVSLTSGKNIEKKKYQKITL